MTFHHVRRCNLGDLALETGLQHQILLVLADRANEDGVAWPSVETIASACYVGRRAIQKTLRRIEALGLLSTTLDGPKGCSRYRLTLPRGGEPRAALGEPATAPSGVFHVAPAGEPTAAGGEPEAAPGEPAAAREPETAGGEPAAGEGRPVVREGAAPRPPEATGSNREDDDTEKSESSSSDHQGEDTEPDARWRAIVAAHEAGDGPWLTFKGENLRGQWLEVTAGQAASVVRVNLAQWRSRFPTNYSEQLEQQAAAAARSAEAERQQARRAADQAEQDEKLARAQRDLAAEEERFRPLLPSLLAWIRSGTEEGRDLSALIMAAPRTREALDLVHTGKPYGVKRLRQLLDGRARSLLEQALLEITQTAATAATA